MHRISISGCVFCWDMNQHADNQTVVPVFTKAGPLRSSPTWLNYIICIYTVFITYATDLHHLFCESRLGEIKLIGTHLWKTPILPFLAIFGAKEFWCFYKCLLSQFSLCLCISVLDFTCKLAQFAKGYTHMKPWEVHISDQQLYHLVFKVVTNSLA